MKHLLKKISIAGAGKNKDKPKPATLQPPQLGELQFVSSYSYAEILDLISDGPIEGLVSPDGKVLKNQEILQGIYLDDTAIAISNGIKSISSDENNITNYGDITKMLPDVINFFKNLTNLFIENDAYTIPPKNNKTINNFSFSFDDEKLTKTLDINYFSKNDSYLTNNTSLSRYTDPGGLKKYYLQSSNCAVNTYPLSLNTEIQSPYNEKQITELYIDSFYNENIKPYSDLIIRRSSDSPGSQISTEIMIQKIFNRNFGYLPPKRDLADLMKSWFLSTIDFNQDMVFVINTFENNSYYTNSLNINSNYSYLIKSNEPEILRDFSFRLEDDYGNPIIDSNDSKIKVYDFIVPQLDNHSYNNPWENSKLETQVFGFYMIVIKGAFKVNKRIGANFKEYYYTSYSVPESTIKKLCDIKKLTLKKLELNYIGYKNIIEVEFSAETPEAPGNLVGVFNSGSWYKQYNFNASAGITSNSYPYGYLGRKGYYNNANTSTSSENGNQLYMSYSEPQSIEQGAGSWIKRFLPATVTIYPNKYYVNKLIGDSITINMNSFYRSPYFIPDSSGKGPIRVKIKYGDTTDNLSTIYDETNLTGWTVSGADIIPLYSEIFNENFNIQTQKLLKEDANTDLQKYNYTNILAEYKNGDEYQLPFKYFKHILIDKHYSFDLLGPFKIAGTIQKIIENSNVISKNPNINYTDSQVTESSSLEGSVDDNRLSLKNYSEWNEKQSIYNEYGNNLTHYIYNPNVTNVFITILIESLKDAITKDIANTADGTLTAGSPIPAIVNIQIETGHVDESGFEQIFETRKFKIIALITSPTLIDLGNSNLEFAANNNYNFIKPIPTESENFYQPFDLPPVENAISAKDSFVKRYVKITKLSTETNSVLIEKKISVNKITEIIPQYFNYPFSSIVATKIDARSFSSIPNRTFDCKLKKVKVPSNYFPCLTNGKDKRYYTTQKEFDDASSINKLIYDGDWDGTFNPELQWTDNPAWILYDLIISERYGLGQYLDINQIDIFDLYKIGQFCDNVDDSGYFIGVPDGAGGVEPRFSCNVMFSEGIKVFDAINTIASLFRGIVYYNNSQINFVDDRPKDPVVLFSNTNVKDGLFNYTNYRRDEQFNSIEIIYIDRFENFLTKIEYVEDEEDIRKRGVFKKTINGNGITSKAMARRLGQHLIFQTIKENQSITFSSGLESLLCKPGDLIIIEDELKSLKSNFGKVLSVNSSAGSIRLNEKFITGEFNNKLTVYTPTGYSTSEEILNLTNSPRSKLFTTGFYLNSGGWNSSYNYLTGFYNISSYVDGFSLIKINKNDRLRSEYAYYTGANNSFCYFSTQFTGWVLGTGIPFTSNNTYNKFIFDKNNHDFNAINRGFAYYYNSSISSGRSGQFLTAQNGYTYGVDSKFRDVDKFDLQMTHGLVVEDISLSSIPQITTFNITGITQYEYGCEAFVSPEDINYSLISFVKEGSVYRFQKKLADDQIYKVISIKEENPNEYLVIATKFDEKKYALIENYQSIENQSNTYSYSLTQKIGDTTYNVLSTPTILSVTTGIDALNSQFYISGDWKPVLHANGYNIRLYQPNGIIKEQTVDSTVNASKFYIEGIGNYSFRVSASGSYANRDSNPNTYFNSDYSTSGLFLVYENSSLLNYDRPFLSAVTIL